MSKFYSLKVSHIEKLTSDSVCIRFDCSEFDSNLFQFKPGQYITINHKINGQEIRRSYSLSSSPDQDLEIGVKLVHKGLMSTFLVKELKVGDFLDVMPPNGNFILDTNSQNKKHYFAICAGSGITPVLSMIRKVLNDEPDSYFTLVYGNRTKSSTMFSDEIKSLEFSYQSQLLVFYAYSKEKYSDSIFGRINNEILKKIFDNNPDFTALEDCFLCGPGDMIDNCSLFLENIGIDKNKIHFEKFTSSSKDKNEIKEKITKEILSQVTASVDGDDFTFSLSSNHHSILDAVIEEGADAPFSCKGGVCCVCKAKVLEGEVEMDQNFALSEEEVAQGFVLACQSHPVSEKVIIDFDEI